jgi:hypothetical protein
MKTKYSYSRFIVLNTCVQVLLQAANLTLYSMENNCIDGPFTTLRAIRSNIGWIKSEKELPGFSGTFQRDSPGAFFKRKLTGT